MRERLMWVRWVFLAIAVAVLVFFLVAQRQSHGVDVSYGQSPSDSDRITEGDGNELTDQDIPSTTDIQHRVDRERVVVLPGAVARWDEKRVSDALGDRDFRILVAPPGLSKEQKEKLDEVEGVDIHIVGTSVTGGVLAAVNNDIAGWRAEYATGDVTNLLMTLIAKELDEEPPSDVDLLERRIATDTEIAVVAADLSAGRPHIADGATLEALPGSAAWAFPDEEVLVAAFPRQEFGVAMPDYGPALAERFPGQPIVVMYGDWIEYHGPQAGEFAEVAAASFYAQLGSRLSRWDYPQQNVLHAYLNRVTDIRYAGIFDRPLPYQPFDPLRVALPALPWLFGGCVLVFLALSIRPIFGAAAQAPRTAPARLALLNTLAVEISGLSHDPSLVRGIKRLQAASAAIDDGLPRQHVERLIGQAHNDLDETARRLGRQDLRPKNYVASGVM